MSITGIRCLTCGFPLDTELACTNQQCHCTWQSYEPLVNQYGESYPLINQHLRINDLRGAVLPPTGQVLTPITDALITNTRNNQRNGGCILLGGDDIEDLLCQTLIVPSGEHHGKEHLVMLLKVRADLPFLKNVISSAESRVISALAGHGDIKEKTINVTEKQLVKARLDFDIQHKIYEKLTEAAKSLNYHFGSPNGVWDGVLTDKVVNNTAYCKELLAPLVDGSGELAEMAKHYWKSLLDLEDCIAVCTGTDVPEQWKKTQWIDPFEVEQEQTVVVKKTVKVEADEGEGLPYKKINGILDLRDWKLNLSKFAQYNFKSEGLLIDLDNNNYQGWTAIYYPYGDKTAFSLQGTLELISPAVEQVSTLLVTEGVFRMRQLNLVATLASQEDAEYLYLAKQAWALGLTDTSEFKQIMLWDEEEEIALNHLLEKFVQELAKLNYQGDVDALAQSVLLDSQQIVKLRRRTALQNFIAKYIGMSAKEMISHPAYMRIMDGIVVMGEGKQTRSGAIAWNRIDSEIAEQKDKFKSCYVYSKITGSRDNIIKIIQNGGMFWCSYRRYLLGITNIGKTLSPEEDMSTGGAGYLFGFVKKNLKECTELGVIWSAETFFANSAIYGYPSDHFGAISPNDRRFNKDALTTDLNKLMGYVNGEIMIKNFISLYGLPPLYIVAESKSEREKILKAFEEVGVSEIKGRSIQDIVICR